MRCIYKITNQINGKCYIGQTIDVRNRFRVHRNDSKSKNSVSYNYPLYRAMRKYGLENFEFAVIEVVDESTDLLEREVYWYNHFKPEYNQFEPTRTQTRLNKPLYMIDTNTLEIVKRFDGFNDAHRYFGASVSSISAASNGKRKKAKGHYWVFVKDYTEDWEPPRKTNYNIIAENISTGEKRVYQTGLDAQKDTGANSRRISDVINGKKKTTHGWTFYKEEL
jgi:hypothetical protein